MSDNKNFRIILDLSRFFLDHRRVARVFVKDKLKTVEDLHKKIKDVFGLEGFYLTTGEHFLPVSEDIRVLHNDENVRVNPDETTKHKASQSKSKSNTLPFFVENKPQKRRLHVIDEESETSSKKKKIKKRHRSPPQDSSTSEQETDEVPKPKRKEKYRDEVKNLDLENKVSDIKKKLKKKIRDYVQEHATTADKPVEDINTLLPKLRNYVKNTENKPEMVQLTHRARVDTPIVYNKYQPPQRTTCDYLAEKKINIVRIDVVKPEMDVTTVESTATTELVETPPENYVKTIVSSLEKQDTSPQEDKTLDISSTTNPKPKKVNMRKVMSGLGAVMEQLKDTRESDSGLSQETDTSLQFVTKRTRIRKRKRPSKDDTKPEPTLPMIPKPMFTQACPKMHLKFNNESENEESGVSTGKSLEENGIVTLVLSDEEHCPMEEKDIFSPSHINSSPIMDKLDPRVGDIIAFKVLKLSENYVPKVSEFVVGRVEVSSMETKQVQFKIMSGIDELTLPAGKFSVEQETSESALREFAWTELIEPRLLFP